MAQGGDEEVAVGGDAAEVEALEGAAPAGRPPRRGSGAWATTLASIGSKSTPTTEPASTPESQRTLGLAARREGRERAGGGQEPGAGVLGVEAGLDGVAGERDVVLPVAERLAGGDAQLLAHQVDAGDLLGDRVLDLQPGVHLEEEELAGGVVDQELDRAGRLVADARAPAAARPRPSPPAGRRRRRGDGDSSMIFWWRRWIEHSRSPRCTSAAVGVAEDLDLDVAGPGDVALEEDPVVAEAAGRLAPGGGHRLGEVGRPRPRSRMPLPPPPAAAFTSSG